MPTGDVGPGGGRRRVHKPGLWRWVAARGGSRSPLVGSKALGQRWVPVLFGKMVVKSYNMVWRVVFSSKMPKLLAAVSFVEMDIHLLKMRLFENWQIYYLYFFVALIKKRLSDNGISHSLRSTCLFFEWKYVNLSFHRLIELWINVVALWKLGCDCLHSCVVSSRHVIREVSCCVRH